MANPQPRSALSLDAFLAWTNQQADNHQFLDGEVYALVGAQDAHVTVAGNVFSLLRNHLRGSACRVYISDMQLRVDAADASFYPDVLVTCDARDRAPEAELAKRYPVLIVEVLSDSTAAFDRGKKFAACRKIETLREYALIDTDSGCIDCFRRGGDGHWVLMYAYEGEAAVEFASVDLVTTPLALFEDVPTVAAAPCIETPNLTA